MSHQHYYRTQRTENKYKIIRNKLSNFVKQFFYDFVKNNETIDYDDDDDVKVLGYGIGTFFQYLMKLFNIIRYTDHQSISIIICFMALWHKNTARTKDTKDISHHLFRGSTKTH